MQDESNMIYLEAGFYLLAIHSVLGFFSELPKVFSQHYIQMLELKEQLSKQKLAFWN